MAIAAAVVGWAVFNDQGGQTQSNESFDRYDSASDKFAASRKESIRKKIEAYEKELAETKSKIAAKRETLTSLSEAQRSMYRHFVNAAFHDDDEVGSRKLRLSSRQSRYRREISHLETREKELHRMIQELHAEIEQSPAQP